MQRLTAIPSTIDPCAALPAEASEVAQPVAPAPASGEHGKAALAAACLAIGLASAWTPEAQAAPLTRIDYQSSLTGLTSLTYLRVMFHDDDGSGTASLAPVEISGLSLPGMGSGSFTSEIDTALFGGSVAMIGVGQAPQQGAAQRLVISMDSLTYLDISQFETTFPGFSEAVLIDELINGGPSPSLFLRTFFPSLQVPLGAPSSCFTFASSDPIGTMSFNVASIPAPGALTLLSVGFIALHRRRR